MTSERQITFFDINGKFTKDFDTFGKMDPFIQLTLGKCIARTETANGTGKEPSWKNTIVLNYFQQSIITVKAYDEDATENQYIGCGKLEINSLSLAGGTFSVKIITEEKEEVGVINGKYSIKNLAVVPLLAIKNIKCDFLKENSLILKTKPYVNFSTQEGSTATESKEDGKGLNLTWNQNLRLRIKQNSKIVISLLDKNQNDSYIFKIDCNAKQLRFQSGHKKFYVLDKNFLALGSIQFDFTTYNLVSKEQSLKNSQNDKKLNDQLTSITIDRIKTNFKKGGDDIYFKFIIGSNQMITDVFAKAPKDLSADLKKNMYADKNQNKIIVVLFEKNFLKDKAIGVSKLSFEGLTMGDKRIVFNNPQNQKEEIGSAILTVIPKQVSAKIITLSSITVNFVEGGDMLGESQTYIKAKIGGWAGRTESGDANDFKFKNSVELKFTDEKVMDIQVWDEDVTNDEILYSQKVNISDLTGEKGDFVLKLTKNEQNKISDKGKVTFKYQIKINQPIVIEKDQDQNIAVVKKQLKIQKSPQVKAEPKVEEKKEVKVEPIIEVKPQPIKTSQVMTSKVEKLHQEKPINIGPVNPESVIKKVEQKPTQLRIKTEPISEQSKNRQIVQKKQRLITEGDERNRIISNASVEKSSKMSVNRSKDNIKLPSINSVHNYGDHIFERQSAATLQKSILAFSIPKASRFLDRPKYTGEPSYYNDSSFKANPMKGAGIGYGHKKQFPEWVEKNMKENPAPGAYNDLFRDAKSKGPTFGVSRAHYQKVLILKEIRPSKKSIRLSPIAQRLK